MVCNGVDEGSDYKCKHCPATSQVAFYRPAYMHSADVKQSQLFKTRLTNAELVALTA